MLSSKTTRVGRIQIERLQIESGFFIGGHVQFYYAYAPVNYTNYPATKFQGSTPACTSYNSHSGDWERG